MFFPELILDKEKYPRKISFPPILQLNFPRYKPFLHILLGFELRIPEKPQLVVALGAALTAYKKKGKK